MARIKNLAPELQELAHIRQKEQGNDGTFNGALIESTNNGNFHWDKTPEGYRFWASVDSKENMLDFQS